MSDTPPPADRAVRPSLSILAAIAASGTLSMHIFVPALPAVARQFDVQPSTAQLTLTLYLVGIAGGQLLYGPLSDRFGRRPVLIAALAIFLVGTLLAGIAPRIEWLITARVLQALGACGGLVLGRAMVRDGASTEQAARQIAFLVMAMTTTPALAPLVGGAITGWLGWRAIFAFLGVTGLALLVLTALAVPETNRQRVALPNPLAMIGVYGRLLRLPQFRALAIGGSCMSTSMYAFFASSPFLFIDVLHRPASEIGAYYVVIVAGVTLGSWIASRLTIGSRAGALLPVAAGLGTIGAGALLVIDLAGWLSVPAVLAAVCVFALGAGIASPVATARAISADPRAIGAASGLYGFMQMTVGALATLLVGIWHGDSALAAACILLAASLIAQVSFFVAARR
ncbi:MAG TPA: multidrug effflux MFS transporter [Vineibacter sp.]|nr:multidrug effflux MFS transporter [Vineibacter sp.]